MNVFITLITLLFSTTCFSKIDGRELYFKECQKCHRKEGRNGGIISDVAGKSSEHLAQELFKFKSGKRIPLIFAAIKKRLTSEQINSVADYMSKMDSK